MKQSPWTEERKALLRRDYPAGMTMEELERRFNALPGQPLDKRVILSYASSYLRLHRSVQTPKPKRRFAGFVMRSARTQPKHATATEEQMIADHIARHGVTRLPCAAVEVTTATIDARDRQALAAYRQEREAEFVPLHRNNRRKHS